MASQWPPRSPHAALLGTPGGRQRVRRVYEQSSPSPSPSPSKSRTSRPTSVLASRLACGAGGAEPSDELNEDDDEETLQLKLQAIQARLRLKKLQAAKTQRTATAGLNTESHAARPESASASSSALREVPLQSRLAAARERAERQVSQNPVQVPASPVKKAQGAADVQTSPQRILLGIDKGRRAADVSLKRAPSLRKLQENGQPGGYLRRSKTPNPAAAQQSPITRPPTFNERLASARSEEVSRQERQERILNLRSTAFSVGQLEMEQYKTVAVDMPDMPAKPEVFSREEILATANRQNGALQRSNTAPSIRAAPQTGLSESEDRQPAPAARAKNKKVPPADVSDSEASAFEPYSGLHLSKRILPHKVLARTVSGKKTYLLKDLLRHVKAPDWSLPDIEQDVVVLAIISSKSDPRHHKPGPGTAGKQQQDRGKYMVMTLVDLKFEVELFLFNSGFDRFWKLTPGTVVAVLNPTIMPPPAGREATGRFSLVINHDADMILEIGGSRDLGYCKSIKRDGKPCGSWINAKRTEYCEFHTNEAVRKIRNSRIELNGTSFGGDGMRRKHNAYRVSQKPEEEQKKLNYDRETQSRWFISGASRSGGILDDEREGGVADRAEKGEALKRRLAQKERERDIAKRLGEIGGGAGKEYMSRAATSAAAGRGSSMSSSSSAPVSASASSQNTSMSTLPGERPHRPDARALGLVVSRGEQPRVDLGRVKRKRPESSQSSSTVNGSSVGGKAALGWGSVLKNKLSRMKDGENLDTAKALSITGTGDANSTGRVGTRIDGSPVRKKTRFVTEKGIREAGRESLGEPLSTTARGRQVVLDDDDDDDDLIIVK